jgi:hypothetical protein
MASALPTFTDKLNTVLTVYNLEYLDGGFTVADLAELRLVQASAQTKLAVVANVGDDTSAIYRWDSASTTADDGLLTIAPSDGSTGRWIKGV